MIEDYPVFCDGNVLTIARLIVPQKVFNELHLHDERQKKRFHIKLFLIQEDASGHANHVSDDGNSWTVAHIYW